MLAWLYRIKVHSKMLIVFGTFVVLMTLLTIFTFWELSYVGKTYNNLVLTYIERHKILSDIGRELTEIRYYNLRKKYTLASDKYDKNEMIDYVASSSVTLLSLMHQYKLIIIADTDYLTERENVERIAVIDDIILIFNTDYMRLTTYLNAALVNEDTEEFARLIFENEHIGGQLALRLQHIIDETLAKLEVKLDETVKNPLNKRGTFAIILGFIVIFSLTFTFFVSKIIRRQYIYEKNLEEVAQKAESASVAKSAFLANMSHEIRTPMNSIMGFSELAMDENITKEAITTYLWQIRKNSEWLLQIINDILDISKIEAGKIELESIPFDLDAIFNNCQMDIRHRVQDKGLALYCYAEPLADKILLGDPTRLRQIFTNFLSNSVKFTYIGIIRLSAKVKSTTDDTATITFEVKDSGIGMTPAQVQHVFEPFMQADSSTTRKYGGTGLGLPITKNMIELMGGKLLIDSAEGIGTKFNFEITFKTIAKDVGTTIKLSTDVVEKPNFKGTVLVFEDNKMNYNLIHDHLIRVGLDVVGVENGKIGVDLLKDHIKDGKQPFDLILMDMQMPVMDGLTAAEIISEMELKTPIVALTANVMVHDLENYQKKGIHDILGKPFTSQSLWQCLLKHLEPTEETHEQQTTELQPNSDNQIATKDDGFDDITRATLKKMFQTEIRDMYKNISNALNNDDISTAHRLAHTLKGNSALFNYQNLNEIAAVVEQNTSHNKNTLTATHLLTLEKELHTVLNQLDNELQ